MVPFYRYSKPEDNVLVLLLADRHKKSISAFQTLPNVIIRLGTHLCRICARWWWILPRPSLFSQAYGLLVGFVQEGEYPGCSTLSPGEQLFLHRCLASPMKRYQWLHLASQNCVNYNPFVSNAKWFLKINILHGSVLLYRYSNWINTFLRIPLTHTFTTGIFCTAWIGVDHPRAPNSVHSWEAPHCCLSSTVNKRLLLYNTTANCSALIVDNHFALKKGKKKETHTGE
jgi:hypothetical protein